jgi:hypothetical protein
MGVSGSAVPVIARAFLFALLVALGTGCYSFTAVGRARTLDKKGLELFAAPGVRAIATPSGDANIRPTIDLGGRYGVTDRVDLGLRAGEWGASAAARVQLHRGASKASGVDVLVAPGLAYTLTDKLAIELPCVVGINLRGEHQIIIAPRVVYQARFGVGDLDHPAQFVFVGASVGFVLQASRHVAFMPEFGMLFGVYAEPGFTTFTTPGPAIQAGIGILWDR